ncbi:MAG: hypothetical protein KatS3mg068_2457 [Candidatus Sericytochromatia bacterium]|nr:MAG: hypothetical protein KatS3mg068_2457 [Candidatus Sericytochromatia bacterium]
MGVIQSLRSQATAARAQADTQMQVSGYLASVNKSLGTQVDQLIDGLQAAINERTKAYNGIVSKLTQQVSGKGGIGDQGVQFAFSLVKAIIATASSISMGTASTTNDAGASSEASLESSSYNVEMSVASTYASFYDFITPAMYSAAGAISNLISSTKNSNSTASDVAGAAAISAEVLKITSKLLDLVKAILQGPSISKTIESLTYDYRRMAAQLGFTTEGTDNNLKDQGASKHLNMRDSLLLRYKPKDGNVGPVPGNKGYVGTLRRRV